MPDGQTRDPKTFYMTSSWLVKWREFFDPGWGVDEVGMRQAFAFYNKVVLSILAFVKLLMRKYWIFLNILGCQLKLRLEI